MQNKRQKENDKIKIETKDNNKIEVRLGKDLVSLFESDDRMFYHFVLNGNLPIYYKYIINIYFLDSLNTVYYI